MNKWLTKKLRIFVIASPRSGRSNPVKKLKIDNNDPHFDWIASPFLRMTRKDGKKLTHEINIIKKHNV